MRRKITLHNFKYNFILKKFSASEHLMIHSHSKAVVRWIILIKLKSYGEDIRMADNKCDSNFLINIE